jgi:hypothetical protein
VLEVLEVSGFALGAGVVSDGGAVDGWAEPTPPGSTPAPTEPAAPAAGGVTLVEAPPEAVAPAPAAPAEPAAPAPAAWAKATDPPPMSNALAAARAMFVRLISRPFCKDCPTRQS